MNYLIKNKIRFLFIFILAIILLLSFVFSLKFKKDNKINFDNLTFFEQIITLSNKKDYSTINLLIAENKIETELVFSQEAKSLGLSFREGLGDSKGMLFVFDGIDYYPSFVMREMNFPLDIIFIKDAVVKKIFHNLEPEGKIVLNSYSYGPADMVLELPGNYSRNNNIVEGSEILIIK